MAQLATAAEGATTAEASAEAGIEALADTFIENDDNPPEEEPEEGELEGEGEAGDEAEGDDTDPPIEAPVSWTAEEKEAFKALPREIQETVNRRETERERFVQTKASEAAQAKAAARKEALAQVVEIDTQAVQRLQQLQQSILAQPPDPRYLRGNDADRAYYYEQEAIFKQAEAQQQALQREADQHIARAQNAQQELTRQEQADFRALLTEKFPEYLDPSQTAKHQQELGSIASELGYPPELIANATAHDILAIKAASEWKAKATKYDTLMAGKMKGVREAKQLPKVARPGASVGTGAVSAARRTETWERAKRTRSGEDLAAAFEARGIKL